MASLTNRGFMTSVIHVKRVDQIGKIRMKEKRRGKSRGEIERRYSLGNFLNNILSTNRMFSFNSAFSAFPPLVEIGPHDKLKSC